MKVRLNKYLKDLGVASRRECDNFIKAGYVTVNGKLVSELGTIIDTEKDLIECNVSKNYTYIMLNKPVGYITSKSYSEGKSIYELIPNSDKLSYAGRLDKESEGLIIMSDDGKFIYSIFDKNNFKEKEYYVKLDKHIKNKDISVMESGMTIDGILTRPAKVMKIDGEYISITITEGLNRQIRKMAEKLGYKVLKLKRVRIGNVYLGDLKPGEFRYLTKNEIDNLNNK